MSTTTYDPYALSSGLLDDFTGEITEAYFGTDAAYNSGDTVLLILELATDNPDTPTITEKLSCGTGWVIENQGASVASENGRNRNFNKNSRVGLFLAHAAEAGALDTLRGRGTPMEAKTFQGLTFHWNRKPITGYDGQVKDVLLPSEFLHDGKAAVSSNGNGNGSAPAESGVSAALLAKLKAAAKKAADHSEFIDAGFAIDGVTGNAEAEALVVDEAFYTEHHG